jgi:hypothetical protein
MTSSSHNRGSQGSYNFGFGLPFRTSVPDLVIEQAEENMAQNDEDDVVQGENPMNALNDQDNNIMINI